MKIKVTDFAKRHFDPKFGATKILNYSIEDFENIVNNSVTYKDVMKDLCGIEHKNYLFKVHNIPYHEKNTINESVIISEHLITETEEIIEGYAPFCKLLPIKNFTDAKTGSLPITLENYQYIRSGYSARRESELSVFSRWLELPVGKPKAEWLMLVLYSKEQIDKEAKAEGGEFVPFDGEWGVVAILGQTHSKEEPMKPETMLRNAGYALSKDDCDKLSTEIFSLIKTTQNTDESVNKSVSDLIMTFQGIAAGGSGAQFDKKAYDKSVEFWSKNITVK